MVDCFGKKRLAQLACRIYFINITFNTHVPFFVKGVFVKKIVLVALMASMWVVPETVQAKGGVGPCLATCIFSDTRIGLALNEGKEIETYDWITLASSFVGLTPVAKAYAAYENGYKQAGMTGFCVGYLWGPRPGRMFDEYKLRSKEIMLCIPCVQLYPMIALPCEAYNGKTLTEVIEEEGLKR